MKIVALRVAKALKLVKEPAGFYPYPRAKFLKEQ